MGKNKGCEFCKHLEPCELDAELYDFEQYPDQRDPRCISAINHLVKNQERYCLHPNAKKKGFNWFSGEFEYDILPSERNSEGQCPDFEERTGPMF